MTGSRASAPSLPARRGLLAYGASQIELARRATFYVARIPRGAKRAISRLCNPAKFELVINLKTAKTEDRQDARSDRRS
jgi:hypothetical protein